MDVQEHKVIHVERLQLFIIVVLTALLIVAAYFLRTATPEPLKVIGANIATDGHFVYYSDQVIWKADPSTFIVLDSYYGKDKNNVYYFGGTAQMMPNADAQSFQILGNGYAKDNRGVYFYATPLTDADTASFKMIGNYGYAKDNQYVYWSGVPIYGADPNTFTLADQYSSGYDAKDHSNFYFGGAITTQTEIRDRLKSQTMGE